MDKIEWLFFFFGGSKADFPKTSVDFFSTELFF